MRWTRTLGGRIGLGLILAAAATSAPINVSLADPLVVRATGPSASRFTPGSRLPEASSVTLRAQDVLTLMNDGRTWNIRGPGAFPVSGPVLADAGPRRPVLGVNDRRVRIGAVRTVDGLSLDRPNLWMIDVAQPGPACVVDTSALMLWRAEADDATTGRLALGEQAVNLTWAAGQASQDWPSALPATPGETYRLTTGETTVDLVLTPISGAPASVTDAAAALIASGCETQLNFLLAQLEQAETEE